MGQNHKYTNICWKNQKNNLDFKEIDKGTSLYGSHLLSSFIFIIILITIEGRQILDPIGIPKEVLEETKSIGLRCKMHGFQSFALKKFHNQL